MLDLPYPIVERFLAEGDSRKIARIADPYEHGAPLGIGKRHKRLDASLVKGRLELERLGFAGADQRKNFDCRTIWRSNLFGGY